MVKITLAVLGGGSLIGRHLCRRATRIGWDVHAYSIYDIEQIYRESTSLRQRTFYNRGQGQNESEWLSHLSWITDCNYDDKFEELGEEIRNVTGLVYFYEKTPLLQSGNTTFEQNVLHLAKLAGDWSVRHFVTVQSDDDNNTLSNKTQQEIGQTNPFMIVSLLRPGKIYSYSHFTSCIPVYKNRTLRSIGIDTPPIDIINAETVAKCITTLIHNTNDPNIYRILEGNDIEQYLSEQKVPFDSPNYDYYELDEDNISEDEDEEEDEEEKELRRKQNKTSKNNNKHFISIGFNKSDVNDNSSSIQPESESVDVESESVRDEQENHIRKVL